MYRLAVSTLVVMMVTAAMAAEEKATKLHRSPDPGPVAGGRPHAIAADKHEVKADRTELFAPVKPPVAATKDHRGQRQVVAAAGKHSWHPVYPYVSAESPAAQAARARIENELAKTTTFEYLNESLKDIVEDVSYRHGIPIWIDAKALEDEGIGDTRVTLTLKEITLRSALRRMLSQLELTYLIRDEVLQITTPPKAQSLLVTKIYSVADLMPSGADKSGLVELIQSSIAPETWQSVGGPGRISCLSHLGALAISQQEDVFPEIESLLAAIKQLQNKP